MLFACPLSLPPAWNLFALWLRIYWARLTVAVYPNSCVPRVVEQHTVLVSGFDGSPVTLDQYPHNSWNEQLSYREVSSSVKECGEPT